LVVPASYTYFETPIQTVGASPPAVPRCRRPRRILGRGGSCSGPRPSRPGGGWVAAGGWHAGPAAACAGQRAHDIAYRPPPGVGPTAHVQPWLEHPHPLHTRTNPCPSRPARHRARPAA
jgi:hypothetical protein